MNSLRVADSLPLLADHLARKQVVHENASSHSDLPAVWAVRPPLPKGSHRMRSPVRPLKKRRLLPRGHTVYELNPGLWLVFKPAGHVESEHTHPRGQTLRVIAGRLEVRLERNVALLSPDSAGLRIAPEVAHTTKALADTWLVVER